MNNHFGKVKEFLLELNYDLIYSSEEDNVIVISDEASGISKLVIGVADPILIMEQFLFEMNSEGEMVFRKLLQKNRDIVHGAFALDESGSKVIFRDTLQLEHLDLNELEGSINSLSLLLSEFSNEIIRFSKL